MVDTTKIAIIKEIINSETVPSYSKLDFIKIVIDTEVEEKNRFPYISVTDGSYQLRNC